VPEKLEILLHIFDDLHRFYIRTRQPIKLLRTFLLHRCTDTDGKAKAWNLPAAGRRRKSGLIMINADKIFNHY